MAVTAEEAQQRAEDLERELGSVKDTLEGLLGELDRRRDQAFGLRGLGRAAGAALALLGAAAGGLALARRLLRGRRRRRRPLDRAGRTLRGAGRRLLAAAH